MHTIKIIEFKKYIKS